MSFLLDPNIVSAHLRRPAGLSHRFIQHSGRLTVPTPVSGQPAFNAFVQPLIDRYGYSVNGVQTGGGTVGYGGEFNDQDFFRDAAQIGYNLTLGTGVRHDLYVGYQWYQDGEELVRSSNGWGLVSVPGGRLAAPIAGNPQRAWVRPPLGGYPHGGVPHHAKRFSIK